MHDDELILLFAFAGVAVCVVLAIVVLVRVMRIRRTYARVADKWRATRDQVSLFSPGRLRFYHARKMVTLASYFSLLRPTTQIVMDWPDADVQLYCRQRTNWDWMRDLVVRRLRTGNRDFDTQFRLSGAPGERIAALMSGGVQASVTKIVRANLERKVAVNIGNGKLRLRLARVVRNYHEIDQLLDEFCALYDQLMLFESLEVVFFRNQFDAFDAPPICQVCGEEITASAVTCRRCDTLHHADCWHYFGACSVYACGERRSRRVRLDRRQPLPHELEADEQQRSQI